jgi:hypothetical protein
MSNVDAESLIAHRGLDPIDRAAFRRAAENALATSPGCSSEGSAYRVISKLWRISNFAPIGSRSTTSSSGSARWRPRSCCSSRASACRYIASAMAVPLFKHQGFTKTDIATVTKVFGFWIALGGTFMAGWLIPRIW